MGLDLSSYNSTCGYVVFCYVVFLSLDGHVSGLALYHHVLPVQWISWTNINDKACCLVKHRNGTGSIHMQKPCLFWSGLTSSYFHAGSVIVDNVTYAHTECSVFFYPKIPMCFSLAFIEEVFIIHTILFYEFFQAFLSNRKFENYFHRIFLSYTL